MSDARFVVWVLCALLAGCELGTYSPLDGGRRRADAAHADDAGPSSMPSFSVGGLLQERQTFRTLAGGQLCAAPGACVQSSDVGRWRLDGFAPREPALVSVSHPGHLSQIFFVEPSRSRTSLTWGMWDPAVLDALLDPFGIPRDRALGGLSISVATEVNYVAAGIEGVTFELSTDSTGPFYPELASVGGFRVGSTSRAGSGAFLNVEPGVHVLTVQTEGRLCTEGLRWTGDSPDEFRVEFRADTESVVYLVCPRLVAEGEECGDGDVCDGPEPACLVGPERDICVSGSGLCPPGPACTEGVLLNRCVNAQPRGYDCAAFGARCDASAAACVDLPIEARCGDGLRCADGLACVEQQCQTALRCSEILTCASDCAGDRACEAECAGRTSGESEVLFSYLEACAGGAGCATPASCRDACPAEHHACVTDR